MAVSLSNTMLSTHTKSKLKSQAEGQAWVRWIWKNYWITVFPARVYWLKKFVPHVIIFQGFQAIKDKECLLIQEKGTMLENISKFTDRWFKQAIHIAAGDSYYFLVLKVRKESVEHFKLIFSLLAEKMPI